MENIDTVIKKSELENAQLSCEEWLLPEVAGHHRVSGKENGKVSKAQEAGIAQKRSDEQIEAAKPRESLENANAVASVAVGSSEAMQVQPREVVKPANQSVMSDAGIDSKAIPDSIRDFNEPMTLARLKNIAEQTRKEAYDTGFLSGQADGHKQGLEDSHTELAMLKSRMTELCSGLSALLEREQESLLATLTRVVIRIAESYSEKRLSSDADLIQQVVGKALDAFSELDQRPTVYLSPSDLQLLLGEGLLHDDCDWNEDNTIRSGGCRIKGKFTEIDSTLERQIEEIANQRFSQHQSEG